MSRGVRGLRMELLVQVIFAIGDIVFEFMLQARSQLNLLNVMIIALIVLALLVSLRWVSLR